METDIEMFNYIQKKCDEKGILEPQKKLVTLNVINKWHLFIERLTINGIDAVNNTELQDAFEQILQDELDKELTNMGLFMLTMYNEEMNGKSR